MTSKEFNEKYADYLKRGHYGCALIQEKQINFLDEVFQELISIPEFKYSQIKSKFGYYSFYCKEVDRETIDYVKKALKKLENYE